MMRKYQGSNGLSIDETGCSCCEAALLFLKSANENGNISVCISFELKEYG
jgi:hypothetical protein